MKKKLLTLAMAAVMVVSSAISALAVETELDGSAWWGAHTTGVEVDEDGAELTFTNTMYDSVSNNYNNALAVVFTSDNGKVGGENYVEYFVLRADCYGWGALPEGVTDVHSADAVNTGAGIANLEAAGGSFTSTAPADWATWVTECKAGVDGSLKATVADGKATVDFVVGDAVSKLVVAVDASKPVYVSLTADQAKLTNIKEVVADSNTNNDANNNAGAGDDADSNADSNAGSNAGATTPDTGDSTMVGLLLAVAAVSVVVVLKRRTVAE